MSNESGVRSRFATLGLIFGLLGLLVALFQEDIVNVISPPEPTAARSLYETGKSLVFGKPSPAAQASMATRAWVERTTKGLGGFALIFGIIAFARRESGRIAISSFVAGSLALFWQLVMQYLAVSIVGIVLLVIIYGYLAGFA